MGRAVTPDDEERDFPRRGDVYEVRTPAGRRSAGRHLVVVLQTDVANRYAPQTIVAAILPAKGRGDLPVFVHLPRGTAGIGQESIVHVGQLATVDRGRLGRRKGCVGKPVLRRIDEALCFGLGIVRGGEEPPPARSSRPAGAASSRNRRGRARAPRSGRASRSGPSSRPKKKTGRPARRSPPPGKRRSAGVRKARRRSKAGPSRAQTAGR